MSLKLKIDWIAFFSISLISFFISFSSLPNPLTEYAYGVDSQVYRMMGILMQKGFVPYRDFFDHKGIVLYFINYLGISVSRQNGIWMLEILFLVASIYGVYMIAKRHLDTISAFMMVACLIHIFFYYFWYGNQPDFYSLFFIICGLYIFIEYFETDRTNSFKLVICGISFACVSMMKLNLVYMWVVYSLAVMVKCVIEKKSTDILFFIIWFLAGIAIVYVPILIYLLVNNALSACIDCYLLFNSKYTNVTFKAIFDSTMSFIVNKRFLVSLFAYFLLIFDKDLLKKNIYLIAASFITLVSAPFITNMSGMGFQYYGFSLIYTYIVPFILLLYILNRKMSNEKSYFISAATVMVLLTFLDFTYLDNTVIKVRDVIERLSKNEKIEIPEQYLEINSYIKNNCSENDGLLVCGNSCYIYELADRIPSNRYMYQLIFLFNKSLSKSFIADLENKNPKIIVFEKGYEEILNDILEFTTVNNYRTVLDVGAYIVFEKM